MITSIAVWFLIIQQDAYVPTVQLGPYSDLESCNKVADMRRANGEALLNLPRGCIQVNVPALTLPVITKE